MTDPSPLYLSLKVTLAALCLIFPLGLALACALARRRFPGKLALETALALPLVLPPTVVGYGLLLVLGQGTAFGRWLTDGLGIRLLFTWQSAALASTLMGLPLFVRTASAALASVDGEILEAARIDGARPFTLLGRVLLPLARRGVAAGLLLAGARALGEFGATLMVAGSIPGSTRTMPLALYSAVQAGRDREAMILAAGLTLVAAALVWITGLLSENMGG